MRTGVVSEHVLAVRPRAIDLGICLLPGCGIAQPQDRFEICAPTFTFAARLESDVDVGVERRLRVFREDADDGVGFALEQRGLAENLRIGVECGAPERVAEDRSFRTVRA